MDRVMDGVTGAHIITRLELISHTSSLAQEYTYCIKQSWRVAVFPKLIHPSLDDNIILIEINSDFTTRRMINRPHRRTHCHKAYLPGWFIVWRDRMDVPKCTIVRTVG